MQADHNALTLGILGGNWLELMPAMLIFGSRGKTQFLQTSCDGAGMNNIEAQARRCQIPPKAMPA